MIEVADAAERDYEQPLEERHVTLSESFQRARENNNWVSSSSDDSSTSSRQTQSFIGSLTGSLSGVDGETTPELAAMYDTRRARMFRLLVVAFFLCFSVSLPVLIYLRLRKDEVDIFEASFLTLSAGVINSVKIRLAEKFSAVDSLGRAFTSYELNSNESWPLVTIPDFELRGGHARELGDVLSVGIHPLVNSGMRETWENYTALNIDWFGQAKSKCGAGTGQNLEFSEEMLRLDGESGFVVDDSAGPYLPTWQLTPATENIINLNILSHPIFSEAASETIATSEATISRLENVDSLGQMSSVFFTDYYGCLMQNHFGEQDVSYNGQPLATMFFPVFSSFSTQTRQLVGVLSTLIDFEQLFSGALTEGSGGVLGVLDNNCGDIFSFEVNGQDAVYLGPEDFHNTDYGSFNQKYEFASTLFESASSVEVNSGYCPYTLRVYPQDMLYDDYVTTMPVVYSVTFAVVLLFVIFVVLSYDCYLHRRMSKIDKAAEASRAIVSSLFPQNVRDRILGGEAEGRRTSAISAEPASTRRGSNEHSRRGSNEHSRRGSSNDNSRRCSNEHSRRGSNDGSRRGSNENSSIVQDIMTPIMQPIIQPFTSIMAGVANLVPAKMLLRSFLHQEDLLQASIHTQNIDDPDEDEACTLDPNSKPIADLFPHCTVLFSDIEGFTAWSSEREPELVFILLETIFQAFDRIARKRDIFKVETIGDSYIAVAGLPDPQPDHGVRMTKYARSCLNKVNEITKKLEVSLGPGTGDLRMRFGLHSGPVTAGVLRGEKSRFQLFGDTVNTASRMESSGKANRIQISLSTAQLLIEAGKENWILPRENAGNDVKGHARLQTYWVLTRRQGSVELESSRPKFIPVATIQEANSDDDSISGNGSVWGDDEDWKEGNDILENTDQIERQIEWQVDLLQRLISQIIAGRQGKAREEFSRPEVIKRDGTVLEEISESIELPKFDPRAAKAVATKNSEVKVPAQVVSELREFVKNVAQRYRDNPFHSFAHAVHVTMSANKLLSRIVKPELVNYHRDSVFAIASDMHDYTYGITSDPLTHFAIMFSTLIHDVDHTGVSNPQRNEEDPGMAKKYKERSIAEQNSVDVAWDLLMGESFKHLQKCLFSTKAELMRFRQLLVNLVMATDIFEKEMKSIRESRWERVFHSDISDGLSTSEFRNLKATIVIEHIIQAADVAHTMQHWKVYVKWNECLFREMYLAYQTGRCDKDPSEGWYNGELWFL
jgi:class 3 adenylate cyclase